MNVLITTRLNNFRLAGVIAAADAQTANSYVQFFTTTQPVTAGGAAGGSAVATATLAKPCGSVISDKLVLVQDDPSGDLIAADGTVLWGRWFDGSGNILLDGDVSDAAGTGFFKLSGTDGTDLRAGGRLLLGTSEIT